ncbi:MAG: discoidin domain-containing protein [Tannerella sp.]|nr:discoidin domain-containing protein [Tannerella sp.]
MKSKIVKLIFSCLVASLTVLPGISQTGAQWRIIESSEYDSEDMGVAAYTEADHAGIDKTGVRNSRDGIQDLLDRLRISGGGTVYLSAGKYRIEGSLVIPKGVVLRGDWQQPQKDAPVAGTVLMAFSGRGSEDEGQAFITMEPCTGLYNVAVWYPEQLPENIVPYPPTVLYGRQGVWGNEYCTVRNVTLVNSSSGVVVSRLNGGGCPNIFNLYGTPLSRGIEIDNIADVGRFDRIDFSPDYWAASGLPDAPEHDGAHVRYIRENATGMVMRRNDWSYTCHFSVEGYHTGFYAGASKVANDNSQPNGHNYHLTFKNCAEAIRLDAVASVGIMFTRVRITDCDQGITVGSGVGGSAAQFYDCEISARQNALSIPDDASLKLMMQQSNVHSGEVNISGGILMAVDCDFDNEQPQVSIGAAARTILSGNRFAKPVEISNRSLFENAIDHRPVSIKPLPDFPEIEPRKTKPLKNALYVVTDEEFGAIPDAVTDNTEAIQNALNKAGSEGGGIVFLPPGKYRVNGNLTVPSGVEIKGASDVAAVPMGQGSIIEIYAGKNDPTGTPFLQLSEKSGIRGITFNYPEQRSSMTVNPAMLPKYPYCLQVTGADVYIVNVGVRATYQGIDLFTYPCDNHYIDYFAGHVFKNALRIGGGSSNGLISNVQFNPIVLASGYESPKFGAWPNSDSDEASRNGVYSQNWRELEFMILEDCKDQILYNNFHYGSHQGIIFGKNGTSPSGISMGLGLDASLRSICFEGLDAAKGFNLINTQVVSINRSEYGQTRYLETSSGFTGEVTLFSSDYWGDARYAGVFGGGSVQLIMPHFQQYGSERFLDISGDADIYISTGDVNAANFVTSGKTGQVSVESSVVALTSPPGYRSWWNNLGASPVLNPQATLSRNGWIATASIQNANPGNAIDGNAATRWDTGASQRPGQWFMVNTRQPVKFNTVILDASGSPDDGPAGYELQVSDNGTNWSSALATGAQQPSVSVISLPETTAQFIRITQTGSKSNYWSIHEFYQALSEPTANGTVMDETAHFYVRNKILYLSGYEPISTHSLVRIYDVAGRNIRTGNISENGISLEHIPTGIYFVTLQHGNEFVRGKIWIK